MIENIVGKGEIAHHEQFLRFPQWFLLYKVGTYVPSGYENMGHFEIQCVKSLKIMPLAEHCSLVSEHFVIGKRTSNLH